MGDYLLFIPLVLAFFISLFFTPLWIRKARSIGLIWKDMHKKKEKRVSGSGGIVVLLAFVIAVLSFVAYRNFFLSSSAHLVEILSLLTTVLLVGGIGLIDDLFGWQRGGLPMKARLILVALTSIPLMAINAGRSQISLPLIGITDIGLIYPLILIPLGIMGATTTFNFLAGYNGLEAGEGILILSALGLVAFLLGHSWLSLIAFCMVLSLIGFLFYNFSPAKVFPGDVLTYSVGSLIAIIPILGNFERIAVFFFIPIIIETILKSRGKLQKQSFSELNEDGSLRLKYNKIYSLNHLAIFLINRFNIKATEKRVVYSVWAFQILVILAGLFIFRRGIF